MSHSENEQDEECHEAELARAVMDYLVAHPDAMDTAEGIADWWLMRRRARVDVEVLTRVLHQLTEQSILEEITLGENVRYRLRQK